MQPTNAITREHLEQMGINLEGKDVEALLAEINEEFVERLGAEIAASLSDEQLDEMLVLQEKEDDEALGKWLDANVPELEEMAEDERDIMLGDLAEKADDLASAK